MLVTISRNLHEPWEQFSFGERGIGQENLKRLRLLTWRRMHELGLRTYKEFSLASGISELMVRRVLAPKGNKYPGANLVERWLAALQLDSEDYAEAQSWSGSRSDRSQRLLEWPDEAAGVLSAAALKHETAEFSHDPTSAKRLYHEALYDYGRIAQEVIEHSSHPARLIKAEALYRLACMETMFDRADCAYWHAEAASSLANGIDGDLYLLARRQVAIASLQIGRSGWREGLGILHRINQTHPSLLPILGKRFPDQDPGLWIRLTCRDAVNVLVRQRERTEARDTLADLRRAMRFHDGVLDGFLVKIAEARLKTREGRGVNAMKILLSIYDRGMPEEAGPPHYQTLLSAMSEAQVHSGWRDPQSRDFLDEALQWAHSSGLTHQANELRLSLRERSSSQ